MSASVEEPWAPEPELREPPPRRLRPSDFPDLNTPNVRLFTVLGGILVAAGGVLAVYGLSAHRASLLAAGGLSAVLGILSLTMPARKAGQAKARAERLVREGQPIMARIVGANNLTGDSVYGRVVTYMVTLPGGELVRRDVNADERTLPRRIPGNVTALVDPRNSRDVELYCALAFRAVPRPAPAPQPAADTPAATVLPEGQMGKVDPDTTYRGLPWE